MYKYILKRILIAIPVLIGITIIDYAIMCMAGSPLAMMQGPRVSEAALEAKKIALGLDQPIYVQYFVLLGQLLHGNLGYSIISAGQRDDRFASWTDPSSDGRIPDRQFGVCGAGRHLQCDPSV